MDGPYCLRLDTGFNGYVADIIQTVQNNMVHSYRLNLLYRRDNAVLMVSSFCNVAFVGLLLKNKP